MAGKEKDWAWYIRELKSEQCLCERPKKAGKSFCYRCFSALPRDLQQPLYDQIGNGYEEAFEAAHKYLTENIW